MDRKILAIIALLAAAGASAEERVPLSPARANAEGNKKVAEGQFEEAAGLYRGEALKMPENGILQRNLAGALARAGLGDEALASYGQALRFAEGRQEQAKVYYDLANTLALGGQLEPALEQYTRALMLTPEDMDIKHNIEFLQRMMQEQQQQEQQQQNENSDENQDQQEQQQDGQQQQQEGQDQQQQEQDQSQQQQPEQEPEQEQQPQPQPGEQEEQPMSEEDAQRLLDAMMEEEREFQEMRARQEIEEKKDVEKDW